MSKDKVAHIEVSIGELPGWYLEDEGNNDIRLEDAITSKWHSNPEFRDADISVIYNYQTEMAIVKAYNDDGDLLWQRDDHDYSYALAAAAE